MHKDRGRVDILLIARAYLQLMVVHLMLLRGGFPLLYRYVRKTPCRRKLSITSRSCVFEGTLPSSTKALYKTR